MKSLAAVSPKPFACKPSHSATTQIPVNSHGSPFKSTSEAQILSGSSPQKSEVWKVQSPNLVSSYAPTSVRPASSVAGSRVPET